MIYSFVEISLRLSVSFTSSLCSGSCALANHTFIILNLQIKHNDSVPTEESSFPNKFMKKQNKKKQIHEFFIFFYNL